ncbi:MAG: nucleotidyltransferase family protein [Bacteroidales bacterium]|nr:nucleotidyltransferase family protein [Bacteroidales bacterium]
MAIIAVAILLAILLAALLLAGLLPLPERRLKDIYAGLLDSEESELLSLAFDETKGQDDFDAFLSAWDAENASLKTVLLVAHVLERRDCFKVPDALLPRIKGGIAVAELHNSDISGHFDRIACAFADESVPFAVIKGAAMRIRRPDYPRWMTDTDVLVEEQNYEKAVRLASGLGYGEPMACACNRPAKCRRSCCEKEGFFLGQRRMAGLCGC